ncbi:MAG: hypothetical protein Q8P27_02445 [Candidatus Peregrinibacteria bacterium]|nr:hypothetical protein [Candidatus Peregrinibacteria bacterium]
MLGLENEAGETGGALGEEYFGADDVSSAVYDWRDGLKADTLDESEVVETAENIASEMAMGPFMEEAPAIELITEIGLEVPSWPISNKFWGTVAIAIAFIRTKYPKRSATFYAAVTQEVFVILTRATQSINDIAPTLPGAVDAQSSQTKARLGPWSEQLQAG